MRWKRRLGLWAQRFGLYLGEGCLIITLSQYLFLKLFHFLNHCHYSISSSLHTPVHCLRIPPLAFMGACPRHLQSQVLAPRLETTIPIGCVFQNFLMISLNKEFFTLRTRVCIYTDNWSKVSQWSFTYHGLMHVDICFSILSHCWWCLNRLNNPLTDLSLQFEKQDSKESVPFIWRAGLGISISIRVVYHIQLAKRVYQKQFRLQ